MTSPVRCSTMVSDRMAEVSGVVPSSRRRGGVTRDLPQVALPRPTLSLRCYSGMLRWSRANDHPPRRRDPRTRAMRRATPPPVITHTYPLTGGYAVTGVPEPFEPGREPGRPLPPDDDRPFPWLPGVMTYLISWVCIITHVRISIGAGASASPSASASASPFTSASPSASPSESASSEASFLYARSLRTRKPQHGQDTNEKVFAQAGAEGPSPNTRTPGPARSAYGAAAPGARLPRSLSELIISHHEANVNRFLVRTVPARGSPSSRPGPGRDQRRRKREARGTLKRSRRAQSLPDCHAARTSHSCARRGCSSTSTYPSVYAAR